MFFWRAKWQRRTCPHRAEFKHFAAVFSVFSSSRAYLIAKVPVRYPPLCRRQRGGAAYAHAEKTWFSGVEYCRHPEQAARGDSASHLQPGRPIRSAVRSLKSSSRLNTGSVAPELVVGFGENLVKTKEMGISLCTKARANTSSFVLTGEIRAGVIASMRRAALPSSLVRRRYTREQTAALSRTI